MFQSSNMALNKRMYDKRTHSIIDDVIDHCTLKSTKIECFENRGLHAIQRCQLNGIYYYYYYSDCVICTTFYEIVLFSLFNDRLNRENITVFKKVEAINLDNKKNLN